MNRILFFMMLMVVFSCKTNIENTTTKTETAEMKTSEANSIGKGNLYGSGNEGIIAENLTITNQSDWDKLKAKMDSTNKVSTSFSKTAIDFSKHTIIAVFDEVKGSGGHSIDLSVTYYLDNTTVSITKNAPSGIATSVMTQPYHIIKITKSSLPIKFVSN